MRFCLKNLWQYLPTAAATPPAPLPMHGKLSLPASAILLCLQAIFCAWCCQIDATKASICIRSIFIDAGTRAEATSPSHHLLLLRSLFLLSLSFSPFYLLLPLPCSIFIDTLGVQRSEASCSTTTSFPPPSLFTILPLPTFPTLLYPSPFAAPSPPFSVYLICQKMFTARVLRAAKNALAAIEKCCVRVSQILNAVCQRVQRSRDHHTHIH